MTKKQNRIAKSAVFYRTNGNWAPYNLPYTGKVRTFTSRRELNRFLNSGEFSYDKNYVLKSRIAVRKVTAQ
jgi:hypothetical protein